MFFLFVKKETDSESDNDDKESDEELVGKENGGTDDSDFSFEEMANEDERVKDTKDTSKENNKKRKSEVCVQSSTST